MSELGTSRIWVCSAVFSTRTDQRVRTHAHRTWSSAAEVDRLMLTKTVDQNVTVWRVRVVGLQCSSWKIVQSSFGFHEKSALSRIAAHTQCQTELTEMIGRLAVWCTRQIIIDPRTARSDYYYCQCYYGRRIGNHVTVTVTFAICRMPKKIPTYFIS